MKKIWKNVLTYAVVVVISVGISYVMYSHLDSNRSITMTVPKGSYSQDFDQRNVHLASLTAGGYPDFTKVAAQAVKAVVHVKSVIAQDNTESGQDDMIDPFEYFFGFGNGQRGRGMQKSQPVVGFGSGVLISSDGYIMTNNHVIDKATDIEVTLYDNEKYKARLVGADPNTDIALLKIKGSGFSYIPFGNSDKLKVGEWVLAIGNPFNLTSTVTAGIVSAKDRGSLGLGSRNSIQSFIQTDAAINPGNSGGALINTDGQLVGINAAIYSETGNFAGYGFAVPISIAGKVVADIKQYGVVQRAVLGVLIQDVSIAKQMSPEKTKNLKETEGVYVAGFADFSPAKQAGIKEGDVIVDVNDVGVRNVSELQEQINKFRPGDKVKVVLMRDGKQRVLEVTLKNAQGKTAIVKSGDGLELVGAAFKDLSSKAMNSMGIGNGVQVVAVDHGGRFYKEGIPKGFVIQKVNGELISSKSQLEDMIRDVAKGSDKALFITGITLNGARKYFAVDLSL